MAYSTNIYDLYKKVEENHHDITEAMKMKFAVVNNNGEVIGFTSDAKEAMFMAKNNLRKEKGTVVQLSKPMPQKQADMKIGRKLFAQNTREYLETAKVVKEENLDEKVDMQTKSYINDIARAMTKDKLMKPFADKFKKDAMKTGKPKDSLEKVLPDYIAGKDIAKLLNMGESDHPQDEGFASDAQRRAAFAQGYKAKGKKGKKEEVKEKLMNAYRQQWKELGEKRDPADIDVKATSKDQEMADQNVVMQLRRLGI